MADLSPKQFQVFDQMEEMDAAYPTDAPRDGKFYHGTTSAIKDGMVRPAWAVDKNPSEASMGDPGDMSEGDHAFAIRNDEDYAWQAAHKFHTNGRRPRVYEVDPAPDMVPGPWNPKHEDFLYHHDLDDPDDFPEVGPESDDYPSMLAMREAAEDARANRGQDEWGSKTGFPVRQRIDIMPGRQGTFPEVNWNRFKEGGMRDRMGHDVNHPDDAQVEHGTDWKHKDYEAKIQKQADDNVGQDAFRAEYAEAKKNGISFPEFKESYERNKAGPTLFDL